MKILNPPLKLCVEILEFVFEFQTRKKQCTSTQLRDHFKVTQVYYQNAVQFLKSHNLLLIKGDYVDLSDFCYGQISKSPNIVRQMLLEILMGNQPFIEFTYFLGKGKSEAESVKLVKYLYEIEQSESTLLKIFKEWIRILNIKISPVLLKNETLDGIKESLENKLLANNFIKDFLGDELHNVSEQVITKLSNSIKDITQDNDNSVNEAGRAMEDFLRLDLAKGIDLTRCSGLGEIGNELNKYSYPKKLNNLCLGLANIRSMGKAHGVDKSLNLPWTISDHAAIGYIIMILSLIKSYLVYERTKSLVF